MKCLYFLLVFLIVLDITTTAYALNTTRYVETNPLVVYLIEKIGLLGLSILRTILAFLVGIFLVLLDKAELGQYTKTIRTIVSIMLNLNVIFLSVVVCNNFYQLIVS